MTTMTVLEIETPRTFDLPIFSQIAILMKSGFCKARLYVQGLLASRREDLNYDTWRSLEFRNEMAGRLGERFNFQPIR